MGAVVEVRDVPGPLGRKKRIWRGGRHEEKLVEIVASEVRLFHTVLALGGSNG